MILCRRLLQGQRAGSVLRKTGNPRFQQVKLLEVWNFRQQCTFGLTHGIPVPRSPLLRQLVVSRNATAASRSLAPSSFVLPQPLLNAPTPGIQANYPVSVRIGPASKTQSIRSDFRSSKQKSAAGFLSGAGLAAAGAAAIIAGALSTDTARCESGETQSNDDSAAEGGERRQLYPPLEPHTSGYLKVSDLHKIYWEECGNPDGQPVIFLHGGPGAGTASINRRFFDPDFYRIILVDQRGAGRSLPHASLVDNTTWHLVDDLEKLRETLKIDKWLVFGGSWGSTLSLAYAQTHPERVVGLVLRGIFMIRRHEIHWFYQRGADYIFPDAWEPYRDFIPPEERSGFVAAYHRRLMNDKDPETQMAAARAWTAWEMSTAYLRPSEDSKQRGEDDKFALAFARIENHYFVNGGFFPSDSWLLDNVPKLRHIPAVIIQGRYDVVCPMTSAWDLHRAWPEADFRVVPDAGHSANEVGIGAELVAATERMKQLYANQKDKS